MFLTGLFLGVGVYLLIRTLPGCVFSIGPTERGVLQSFGRAERLQWTLANDPRLGNLLDEEEKTRFDYPQIRTIPPGGPYFKWPWQQLHKVDMTIQTTDLTWDPDIEQSAIEAVTKDNLTVSIQGQIRWRPCEGNLYAYLFGVAQPQAHIMGYFISVLRDRIATFEARREHGTTAEGISINDLRKNLSAINTYMEEASRKTSARYGVELDAALITTIDPPPEVDHALAAINTTQNQVAAEVSQARADAEQQLKQAEQAVAIATNQAEAEAEPLRRLADSLQRIRAAGGSDALSAYLRKARIALSASAQNLVLAKPS